MFNPKLGIDTANTHPVKGSRTHANCKAVYRVARPGKTQSDKLNGHIPYKKNRRVWDSEEERWVKV